MIHPMTKAVVVHAGLPKTGTSAVQGWLNTNHDALAALGIDYPTHPVDGNGVGIGNAGRLLERGSDGRLHVAPTRVRNTLDRFASGPHHTLLLSSEFFGSKVGQLADLLPASTRFVMYVRDPMEFLESDYNQGVKRAGFKAKIRPEPNAYGGWLGHGDLKRALTDISAAEILSVRPYHSSLFEGGNILTDLFAAAELPAPPGDILGLRRVNSSYTLSALEFKRTANHLPLGDLTRDLDRVLQRCPAGYTRYTLISPADYSRLRPMADAEFREIRDLFDVHSLEPLRKILADMTPDPFYPQEIATDDLEAVAGYVSSDRPDVLEALREVARAHPDAVLPYHGFRSAVGV